MLSDIIKPLKIMFKKESLLNLFILCIINFLSIIAFFSPLFNNHILDPIPYFILVCILMGYIIETSHLYILNNCEEINLPAWNINILKYLKHALYLILILTIFNLILSLLSFLPVKILSDTLQLLAVLILSFVIPCCIIIYAKNLKIKDVLNYKLYYQLIYNDVKKFIIIYISTTILLLIVMIINEIINAIFVGPTGGWLGEHKMYLFSYIWLFIYFLIILIYSQLFQKKERTN